MNGVLDSRGWSAGLDTKGEKTGLHTAKRRINSNKEQMLLLSK
jgi:hypothetical protein